MNKLRIALLHLQIKLGDTVCNRQLLNLAIAIAAGYGAQLAVTGELIESGEAFWQTIYCQSIPGSDYPYLESLKEAAYKYRMNLLFGRAYRNVDTGQLYSIYTHINDEGQIQAIYEKQVSETLEEASHLTRGTDLVVTDIEGLEVGLVLGYNSEVQDIINRYVEERVDLIIDGLAPLRHPCSETTQIMPVEVPLLVSNYNLIRNRKLYQGQGFAITEQSTLKFCPVCSEVIILDFWPGCEKFEVVNRVNVNQVVTCE